MLIRLPPKQFHSVARQLSLLRRGGWLGQRVVHAAAASAGTRYPVYELLTLHTRRSGVRSTTYGTPRHVVADRGVHFIQVAKWLGHSSYVLTLTTYADYIPEDEAINPLPEPTARPRLPATLCRCARRKASSSSRRVRLVQSRTILMTAASDGAVTVTNGGDARYA